MPDIAIRVENLSKQYKIAAAQYRHDTLRDQLVHSVASVFRRNGRGLHPRTETFWALKDVSFEVKQGEVVGMIGRNGAGKSTLLKILSRITAPTSGRAEIYGRVGSLLEVGTGFDQELTGRENIYLSGAILGMKKAEIHRNFDEIVAFAEVDKFIDTPVKRYSSGMYVRLAFAVAAHLEPEILLVDEVLAVGDAAFQKKCLGKMGEVAKQGRTILFVSHNMAAIQNLCETAFVVAHGHINYAGSPHNAIQRYMEPTAVPIRGEIDLASHPARRPGSLPLLRAVRLLNRKGTVNNRFLSGEMMKIEFTFDPLISLTDPQFGIGIDDWTGTRIFSLATYLSDSPLPPLRQPCTITCCVDELPLEPGRYTLSFSAGTHQNTLLDALDHPISFEVEASDFFGNGQMPTGLGRVLVRSRWSAQC